MPNTNPAQKLKNEVLQNWSGFKFFLRFLHFDFLSARRTLIYPTERGQREGKRKLQVQP